jgi:hypothetical protein
VAAGVGVAAAKKLGLLAILLKFIKPIAIAVMVGFGVFWRRLKLLFGVREPEPDDWQNYDRRPRRSQLAKNQRAPICPAASGQDSRLDGT